MAPTIYAFDSAELTTAAATGGLVHATGYPLYLLIGRFWSGIPVGDVGFRMNLLSAVCGALTVALLVHLLRRMGAGPWAALCAAGLLASTKYFWAMSLVAEVYTLHTALMCAVILALLYWADGPSPARLGIAVGLLGLAAANHASSVLLAPGCLFFVLAHDRAKGVAAGRPRFGGARPAPGPERLLLSALFCMFKKPQFNYLVHVDSSGTGDPRRSDDAWTVWHGR